VKALPRLTRHLLVDESHADGRRGPRRTVGHQTLVRAPGSGGREREGGRASKCTRTFDDDVSVSSGDAGVAFESWLCATAMPRDQERRAMAAATDIVAFDVPRMIQ
jgi:hypothetical protein